MSDCRWAAAVDPGSFRSAGRSPAHPSRPSLLGSDAPDRSKKIRCAALRSTNLHCRGSRSVRSSICCRCCCCCRFCPWLWPAHSLSERYSVLLWCPRASDAMRAERHRSGERRTRSDAMREGDGRRARGGWSRRCLLCRSHLISCGCVLAALFLPSAAVPADLIGVEGRLEE